ncbi:unnamed protein product [Effrenium voratum]|nr:unnamed protein product [Effrenium voratum]
MARIARRGLRLGNLPLFSLGQPWSSVVRLGAIGETDGNAEGKLVLSLFEPRYVEVAQRLLAPGGSRRFGYAETFPPREHTSGVVADIQDHRWVDETCEEFVPGFGSRPQAQLLAAGAGRFRILKMRTEDRDGMDLYYANVQTMSERDLQRGFGVEALAYWEESREDSPRASSVKPGSHLVAMVAAAVFESPESWRVVGQVPAGVRVIVMDVPRMVEGYLMVPIVPSGAVEMPLFREPEKFDGQEVSLPNEEEMKAAIDRLQRPPSKLAWLRLRRRQLRAQQKQSEDTDENGEPSRAHEGHAQTDEG